MPAGWRARVGRSRPSTAIRQHWPALPVFRVTVRVADLELGAPYAGRHFAGIVVTNYLHRPLLPLIEGAGRGRVLIYETFMVGNERFGGRAIRSSCCARRNCWK